MGVLERRPLQGVCVRGGEYPLPPHGKPDAGSLSPETALVVQALRALGKERVDTPVLAKIARRFDAASLARMERETRNVPDWIHGAIAGLAEEKGEGRWWS